MSAASLAAQEAPKPVPAALAADALDLYLEVFVNGVSSQRIIHLRQTPTGHLLMQPEALHNIGLLRVSEALREDGWIDLSLLPGVRARYEEATQTLDLRAQDAAMAVRVLDAQARQRPVVASDAASDAAQASAASASVFGAFLNHTLYYSTGGARWSGLGRYQYASGLFEGNLYGHFGALSSTQLLTINRANRSGIDAAEQRRFRSVRLDSQWSWFDEDHLMTLSAGDFVGSSLAWSRSIRLAGVQWRRNFAIRPDLVTMPMLSALSGSAAVPSTVELYVNNAQYFAQDVAPGPFAITNLPLMTGAGTARMVVRDALGRETISETPFYASSNLLAPGLSDFALEAGFARRSYGVLSHDYGKQLLASATARLGLTNTITLEGHVQGGARLALAGAGGVFRLGTLGVTSLAGTFSRHRVKTDHTTGDETGAQLVASLELEAGGVRLYARHQRTQGDFNDLASVTQASGIGMDSALARRNARPPLRMSQVSLALPYWSYAPNLNLSYTPMTQADGSRTRLLGISLSQRLPGNGWLSVSANRDLQRKNGTSVFAMLSWFLGNGLSAFASQSWNRGKLATTMADLSQSAQNAYGSVGWRLRAAHGHRQNASRTQMASASYRSRIGRLEAGVEHMARSGANASAASVNGRVQFDGAIVLAGGGVFLANRIHDAFAVVNVGAPNVQVRYENAPIGRTNASGQLLLSGLRAYERNRVSIDPVTLPVDARIPVLRQVVSPRWKSGVVVDFGVALHTRSALVTVRDAAGAQIPMGAQAQLNGGAAVVVGYDGQVWLEEIARTTNRLRVSQPGKPDCVVEFTAPDTMTERLVISDAVCRSEQ